MIRGATLDASPVAVKWVAVVGTDEVGPGIGADGRVHEMGAAVGEANANTAGRKAVDELVVARRYGGVELRQVDRYGDMARRRVGAGRADRPIHGIAVS